MTINEKIVEAALDAVAGRYPTVSKPGYCLQFVREVIENALYDGERRFYSKYLVVASERKPPGTNPHDSPWAVDSEASMKKLGLTVPLTSARPGDIVFNHDTGLPYGHVGILLPGDFIAENIDPKFRRMGIYPDYKAITPWEQWSKITLVARLK